MVSAAPHQTADAHLNVLFHLVRKLDHWSVVTEDPYHKLDASKEFYAIISDVLRHAEMDASKLHDA
jgi:hypothetical protein